MKMTLVTLACCALAFMSTSAFAASISTGSTYYGGERNTNLDDEVDKVRKANNQGSNVGNDTVALPGGGYTYNGGYTGGSGYGGNYPGGEPSPQVPTDAEIAAGTFVVRASSADEAKFYGDTICIATPKINSHRDYVGPTIVFLPGSSCKPITTPAPVATGGGTGPATQVNTGPGTGTVTTIDDRGTTINTNGSTWKPSSVTERVEKDVVTGGNGTPESPYTYATCYTERNYDSGARTRHCVPQAAPKP